MRIKIAADSTCDLPPDIVGKYDIGLVPLYIIKGDKAYKDRVEITAKDIFEYVESGAGITHSGAVNVADYREVFESWLKEYDAVVHINIG